MEIEASRKIRLARKSRQVAEVRRAAEVLAVNLQQLGAILGIPVRTIYGWTGGIARIPPAVSVLLGLIVSGVVRREHLQDDATP